MIITLTLPKKEVKVNIILNYLGTDDNWEPRTVVSDRYKKVDIDEIMHRFMAM
jgi:hypothetical protein